MRLSTKLLRNQIKLLKPIITNCSIEMSRSAQDKLGKIMMAGKQKDLNYAHVAFSNFEAAFIRLKEVGSKGVILYLHGGGYVAGDLDYAKGFGSILAAESGIDVFCPAYRLAPEHPFPAALEDAEEAYDYLLQCGYAPESIALTGRIGRRRPHLRAGAEIKAAWHPPPRLYYCDFPVERLDAAAARPMRRTAKKTLP